MKTYKKDNQHLFTSIKTEYNKRDASKIEVANWQLKAMVPGWSHMDCFWLQGVENADSGLENNI